MKTVKASFAVSILNVDSFLNINKILIIYLNHQLSNYQFMKKLVYVLLLILVSQHFAIAQDLEKIRKEYEAMVKNAKVPYGNNKATGKYYNVRGIKFYCETYGQGAPLLLIHGNGGSINNFIYQIPFFAKHYKVIAVDSRAQGKSIDHSDSLSYEMMADDFAALLDQMKLDSVNVLGWSDGGINALLLSIRHPKKVKKMAITGTNLWPENTAIFQDVIDLVTPDIQTLLNKKEKSSEEKIAAKLGRLIIQEPHIPLNDLHKIQVPTLVMGGDHDVIKPEHTLLIHQNIAKSYLWIAPNSGHSAALVYKNDFNKYVYQFFNIPYRKIDGAAKFF
jgi:pimeloyl-ACP methyl ester carboxylesterase